MAAAAVTFRPHDIHYPAKLHTAQPQVSSLFVRSNSWDDLLQRPSVAIVGSRKASSYGRQATETVARELARAGVVIISGMAIGIDAIAHRAALNAGGQTIAVLPCGLDNPYPARHQELAREIVAQGGALVSEYPPGSNPYRVNFIARNRIVAALSDVVLVTEAGYKSGTLHTARFALEQGRDVAAIPGDITRPTAASTNNLIKSGAALISGAEDIARILGISLAAQKGTPTSQDPREQAILTIAATGETDGAELLRKSGLEAAAFNQALTMLEITGQIRPLGNNHWGICI